MNTHLLPVLCIFATLGIQQNGVTDWLKLAEDAKAKGDMPQMERSIMSALASSPGDEYTWRSLAWAQMRQGKWRESLASARENVRRNGRTSWSLKQLFESAMAAGDTSLAGQALRDEVLLPTEARNCDLSGDRAAFAAATRPTQYDLTWRLKVGQYQLQKGEIVVNTPFRRHLWQTAKVWVEGARRFRIQTIDKKDVLFVDPGEATEVVLRATVTHRPAVRGGAFLERSKAPLCPPDMKALLQPFRNRIDYNPQDPAIAPALQAIRGETPAQRVQSILDWIAANIRYVDGFPDDLASIMQTGKGVCHHQSNLMVSLCRAAGVPALVAHGVSLSPGDGKLDGVVASHGWVEVYLNGIGWVGVEPLDPNSLRFFRSGYLVVDATGHTTTDDHFVMHTSDGRLIEGIQGLPVSGTSKLL